MLRNLILDWSGTLTDDLGPVVAATNLILGRFGGAELLLEEVRERAWSPLAASDDDLLSGVALGEPEALFYERFTDCQIAVRASARMRFGFSVSAMPRGVEFSCVVRCTRKITSSNRLDSGSRAFSSESTLESPTSAPPIGEILAHNDLAATETAFIGGTVRDVETARDVGVISIAILTGSDSRENLARANPEVTVCHLGDLQKLLELVPPSDEIRIEALELMARVGVPDLERAQPQRLTVSMTLQPRCAFGDLGDDLARTVDYAAVCEDLRRFVAGRADKLIETLAHEMAEHLLRCFGLARVELELRKFVLPETKYVAVRVARSDDRPLL